MYEGSCKGEEGGREVEVEGVGGVAVVGVVAVVGGVAVVGDAAAVAVVSSLAAVVSVLCGMLGCWGGLRGDTCEEDGAGMPGVLGLPMIRTGERLGD